MTRVSHPFLLAVINNFRDGLRQAAINLMLGVGEAGELGEVIKRGRTAEERMDALQSLWTDEQALAIRTCSSALPPSEQVLGGWVLISINKRGLQQVQLLAQGFLILRRT